MHENTEQFPVIGQAHYSKIMIEHKLR